MSFYRLMKNRLIIIFLSSLVLISFFLRFYGLQKNLFFGPEQGIDFLVVKDIVVSHKLTLIGAKTDVSGIFHGPIYYYISAVPFVISHGDPLFILGFLIFINSLTVILVYLLGKEMFSKRVGIFTALLYTPSFMIIVYSRGLSTHPLVIPLETLFFLFLLKFLKGRRIYLLLAAIVFGLTGQAEFLNFLFISVVSIFFIASNFSKLKKQNPLYLLLCFVTLLIFSGATYFLFDIRHQFLMSKSVLTLLSGKSGYYTPLGVTISQASSAFVSLFSNTLLPFSSFGGLLAIAIVATVAFKTFKEKNKKLLLLLVWLFAPLVVLLILHHAILDQFFVFSIIAVVLCAAVCIEVIFEKSKYVGGGLLAVVLLFALLNWNSTIAQNRNIFFQAPQPDLRLSDETRVINTICNDSQGSFSYQAYTIPYWESQGWDYLFWVYGQQKFGYAPTKNGQKFYVIIQDDPGNKSFQQAWIKNTVSTWGTVRKTWRFGILKIEELALK
ncbi:MAG TPA: glycosyltransferase family 39 protein [Candidatus Saccharimonadales bacterium]|nr:glycosyltransferase family 39 protein [Candidatus Saccharimonadales bacterium]